MPLNNANQTARPPPVCIGHVNTLGLESEISNPEMIRQQGDDPSRGHYPRPLPSEEEHSLAPTEGLELEESARKAVGQMLKGAYKTLEKEFGSGPGGLTAGVTVLPRPETLLKRQCETALTILTEMLEGQIAALSLTLNNTKAVAGDTTRRRSTRSHAKAQKSHSIQEPFLSARLEKQRSDAQKILQHLRDSACQKMVNSVFLDKKIFAKLLVVINTRSSHSQDQGEPPPSSYPTEITHRVKQTVSLCTLVLCCNHYIWKTSNDEDGFDVKRAKKSTDRLLLSMEAVYRQAVDDNEYSASADPRGSVYVLSLLCHLCMNPGGPGEPHWLALPILAIEALFLADLSQLQHLTPVQAERMKKCIPLVEGTNVEYCSGYRYVIFSLFACGMPVFEREVLAPLLANKKFSDRPDRAIQGFLRGEEKSQKTDRIDKGPWPSFPSPLVYPDAILDALLTTQGIEQRFFSQPYYYSVNPSIPQQSLDPPDEIVAPLPYWLGELRLCIYLLSQAYILVVCKQNNASEKELDIVLANIDGLAQRQAFVSFVLSYLTVKTLLPALDDASHRLPITSKIYLGLWVKRLFRSALSEYSRAISYIHNASLEKGWVPLDIILNLMRTLYTAFLKKSDNLPSLITQEFDRIYYGTFSGEKLSTRHWNDKRKFAKNMLPLLAVRSLSDYFTGTTALSDGNSEKQFFLSLFRQYLRSIDEAAYTPWILSPVPVAQNQEALFVKHLKAAQDLCTRYVQLIEEVSAPSKKTRERGDAYKESLLQNWRKKVSELYAQVTEIKRSLRLKAHTLLLLYCLEKREREINCITSSAGRATATATSVVHRIRNSEDIATLFKEEDRAGMRVLCDAGMLVDIPEHEWKSLSLHVDTIELLHRIGPEDELRKKIDDVEALIQKEGYDHFVTVQKALDEQCRWVRQVSEQCLSELSTSQHQLSKSIGELRAKLKNYEGSLKTAYEKRSSNDHRADSDSQKGPEETHVETAHTLSTLEETLSHLLQTHESSSAETTNYFRNAQQFFSHLKCFLERTCRLIKILEPSAQKTEKSKQDLLDLIPEIKKTKPRGFSGLQSQEETPEGLAFLSAKEWRDLSDRCKTYEMDARKLRTELENQRHALSRFRQQLRNMQLTNQLANQNNLARTELENEISKLAEHLRDTIDAYHPICLAANDSPELSTDLFPRLEATHAWETEASDFSLLRTQERTLEGLWEQYKLRFSHTEESASTLESNRIHKVCTALKRELSEHRASIEQLSGRLSAQILETVDHLATRINALFREIVQEAVPLEDLKKLEERFADIKMLYEKLDARITWCERAGIPLSHNGEALDSLSHDMVTGQRLIDCLIDIAQHKITQQMKSAPLQIPSNKTEQTSQDDLNQMMSAPGPYIETPIAPSETSPEISRKTECPIRTFLDQLQYQATEEQNLLNLQISLESLVRDIKRQNKDLGFIRKIKTTIQQHHTALEEKEKLILTLLKQLFKMVLTTLREKGMPHPQPNLQTVLEWLDGPGEDLGITLYQTSTGNIHLIQVNLADGNATGVMLQVPAPENLPETVRQALEFLSKRYQLDPRQRISSIVINALQQQLDSLDSLLDFHETGRYPEEYIRALSHLAKIAREASRQIKSTLEELLEIRKSKQEIDAQTSSLLDLSSRVVTDLRDCIALFEFEFSYIDQQDRHTHLRHLNIQGTLDMLSGMLRVLESYAPVTYCFPSCVTPHVALAPPVMPNYFWCVPSFWHNPTHTAASHVCAVSIPAVYPGPIPL